MESFTNRQRLLCLSKLRDAAAAYVALYTVAGVEPQQEALLAKAVEGAKELLSLEKADKMQLDIMAEAIVTADEFMSFAASYESRGQRMAFMRLCQAIANRASENNDFAMIQELIEDTAVVFEWFIGEELMRLAKKESIWCSLDS
jgi:hypothetical protein